MARLQPAARDQTKKTFDPERIDFAPKVGPKTRCIAALGFL
jgi:hypothetical protein